MQPRPVLSPNQTADLARQACIAILVMVSMFHRRSLEIRLGMACTKQGLHGICGGKAFIDSCIYLISKRLQNYLCMLSNHGSKTPACPVKETAT